MYVPFEAYLIVLNVGGIHRFSLIRKSSQDSLSSDLPFEQESTSPKVSFVYVFS